MRFSRIARATVVALMLVLPALSAPQGMSHKGQRPGGQASQRQRGNGPGSGGAFSAPEIEVALLSSALLIVGGAALILRDRRARKGG